MIKCKSVSELIKLIENIKKTYFEKTKQLMTPIIEKYNDLKNFNKSKLDKTKLETLNQKIKKLKIKLNYMTKSLRIK